MGTTLGRAGGRSRPRTSIPRARALQDGAASLLGGSSDASRARPAGGAAWRIVEGSADDVSARDVIPPRERGPRGLTALNTYSGTSRHARNAPTNKYKKHSGWPNQPYSFPRIRFSSAAASVFLTRRAARSAASFARVSSSR